MTERRLIVPLSRWIETWGGLQARGGGARETACVWGGTRTAEAESVEHVVFIDDYLDVASEAYSHVTPPGALQQVLGELRRRGLVVVGDVHTHPGAWVDMSLADAENPVEFRIGLFAMILPRFARGLPSLKATGVHVYLGDRCWKRLNAVEVASRVRIVEDL